MREPDFFLVGAPKCGTTALYAMLAEHPEVYVSPVKEPDCFASDVVAAVPGLVGRAVTDWSPYLDLFRASGHALAVGEGSVSYLASAAAPGAIRARCPAARILMVLRDPASRLFSHYTAAVAARATQESFSRWLAAAVLREKSQTAPIGPVTAGRYGAHLRKYRDHFPVSRIHIVWHEDFVRDPATALRGLFRHLDVTPDHRVSVTLRRNETRGLRWPLPRVARHVSARVLGAVLPAAAMASLRDWFRRPVTHRMTAPERAAAIDVYADDLAVLATLTGRNLSRWLDASG